MTLTPDQSLDAIQDSADVEDQDKSKVLFISTELTLEIETVGEGTAEESPPPQALSNTSVERQVKYLAKVLMLIKGYDILSVR